MLPIGCEGTVFSESSWYDSGRCGGVEWDWIAPLCLGGDWTMGVEPPRACFVNARSGEGFLFMVLDFADLLLCAEPRESLPRGV